MLSFRYIADGEEYRPAPPHVLTQRLRARPATSPDAWQHSAAQRPAATARGMSQTCSLQQAGQAAPGDRCMAELFPELHGLLAREALRDEGDSLEAWQRLRLVNKAWHDGLHGETHSSALFSQAAALGLTRPAGAALQKLLIPRE